MTLWASGTAGGWLARAVVLLGLALALAACTPRAQAYEARVNEARDLAAAYLDALQGPDRGWPLLTEHSHRVWGDVARYVTTLGAADWSGFSWQLPHDDRGFCDDDVICHIEIRVPADARVPEVLIGGPGRPRVLFQTPNDERWSLQVIFPRFLPGRGGVEWSDD